MRSVPDLPGLLAGADAVVAMAGYNTSCELLAAGVRALVVPRAGPSQEQRLRAAQLERWGVAHTLDPGAADGPGLTRAIGELLSAPAPPVAPVGLGGLDEATAFFDRVRGGAAAGVR